MLPIQFVLEVRGGYFGRVNLEAVNPAKALLVATANAIAVLCLIVAGAVRWESTAIMLVAAVFGGYGGARIARRPDARSIRGACW